MLPRTLPRRLSRAVVALVTLLAAVVASVVVGSTSPAAAAGCTRLWTGAVGSAWDNKDNWSPNDSAPNSDEVACITAAGTYTVDLSTGGNHNVASLVVGGPGANVTLAFARTGNSLLYLRDTLTVAAGSRIDLGGTSQIGYGGEIGAQIGYSPTFVNNGTITFNRFVSNGDVWGSPANSWSVAGVNNGTMSVASGHLQVSRGITNNGTFAVNAGALAWVGSPSTSPFVQNGTVSNGGTMHVANSGWKQQGGQVTGVPVVIRSSTQFTDTGGTGVFDFMTTRFTGTISAGQTIRLTNGDGGASTTFDAASSIAPGGRLEANILDGNNYALQGSPLTNHGVIDLASEAGETHSFEFRNDLVNAADGRLTVRNVSAYAHANLTNLGTVEVTSAGALRKDNGIAGTAFTQNGSITNAGYVGVSESGWNQQGGAATGNPIEASGNAVFTDTGGTGAFTFRSVKFSGTVGSGQTVAFGGGGGGTLSLQSPSTIASGGRMVSTELDGNNYRIDGAALTNHGTLDIASVPGSPRSLEINVPYTNAASGSILLRNARLSILSGRTFTNHGRLAASADGQVEVQGVLAPAADGTLAFELADGRNGSIFTSGDGSVSPIAGALAVTTTSGYLPPMGTSRTVITGNRGAGTFSTVTSAYDAAYAAGAVSVTRMREPESGTGNPPAAAPAPAPAASVVSARSTAAKVKRGAKVAIYGTVTPSTSGQRVVLQRWTGKTWRAVKSVTVRRQILPNRSRKIGYVASIRLNRTGTQRFRVVSPASTASSVGYSRTIRIRVR